MRRQERNRSERSLDLTELSERAAGRLGVLVDQSGDCTIALDNALKDGGRLNHLVLLNSKVTVEDAAKIVALNPIKLNLRGSVGVNDAFLKELSKAKEIQTLDLDLCKGISPRGFRYISSLPKLTTLLVRGCNLTDAHLKEIGQTSSLLQLFIERNHQVTVKGVEKLGGKLLPVKVVADQPNLYLLSVDKQKALLREYNIQIFRSDNLTGDSFSINKMMELADIAMPAGGKSFEFSDSGQSAKNGSEAERRPGGGLGDE
jgi:hypothetical protein